MPPSMFKECVVAMSKGSKISLMVIVMVVVAVISQTMDLGALERQP